MGEGIMNNLNININWKKVKGLMLILLFFFTAAAPLAALNSKPASFSAPVPFNLFSSIGKAVKLTVQPWRSSDFGGAVGVNIKIPANLRKLEIPGFPLFSIKLGNQPDGKDAYFFSLMYPDQYFLIQLSGEIRINTPTGKDLLLEFGKDLKGPTSLNELPGFDEGNLEDFEPNAALDLKTGEFLLTGINLPSYNILGSGIVIKGTNLALDLSDSFNPWDFMDPPETTTESELDTFWTAFDHLEDAFTDGDLQDPKWKGLYIQEAEVTLKLLGMSDPFKVHHMIIDSSGFTGAINHTIDKKVSIGGFSADNAVFKAVFVRNTFKQASVSVDLNIFNAKAKGTLTFDHKGNWNAKLGPVKGEDFVKVCLPTSSGPHVRLNLEELRLGRDKENGPLVLTVDGKVSFQKFPGSSLPLLSNLQCPDKKNSSYDKCGLDFSGFKITFTSPGNISSPPGLGGWINLDRFKEIDFYGFKYTIRKIGFGTLEGFSDFAKSGWFGLGGNFAFGDEFGVGVSLNEMKFKWGTSSGKGCTLGPWGGVCLEIPKIDIAVHKKNLLNLKGSLEWKEDKYGKGFKGTARASFPTLKLSAAATIIIGEKTNGKYWYFDAMTQFPSGIPIASNVSIYGFMGGVGRNIGSKLLDNNNDGIFEGVEWDMNKGSPGSFVFKAGLVLGTSMDNGYTLNADISLLVETSGPVITLEGRGWLLRNRFDRKESNVYALVRYDGNEDMFLMQVTGQYQVPQEGMTILKIGGGFEVLASEPEWHVYLGWKGYECTGPPPCKRAEQKLDVEVLKIFKANGYFMIGSQVPFPTKKPGECRSGVLLGAGFNYGGEINAKIVTIYARYWGSGDLAISWNPTQTYASFGLGGELGFTLFGIDFGRGFAASLDGQYPNPAILRANVSFSLPLPFPLPDIRISFELKWNDDVTNSNRNKPEPPFTDPLRTMELMFPQGNLAAVKKGMKLSPSTSTKPGIPSDQNGVFDANEKPGIKNGKIILPEKQEKIIQLNPRFVFSFHRPITGGPGDVRPSGGWHPTLPKKEHTDQVGQFRAWYRFRDATLREIPVPEEMFTCVSASGGEALHIKNARQPHKSIGFWGSTWDQNALKAWQDEQKLMSKKPPVGKKKPGINPQLVNERRRQVFTWHVSALPKDDGTSWTDGIFNKESLEIPDPPKALKPGTFYQVKASTRHDWKWSKGTGGKDVDTFYCFRTGPEPEDLTPYVAWTNPPADARNVFYGEDLLVLFNTAGMKAVYNNQEPLMKVYDQQGKEIASGTLTLNGQLLVLPNSKLTGPGGKYIPGERYFVKILHPDRETPVFGFQFTTSTFKHFGALMDDQRTRIGGPAITAAALNRQFKSYPKLSLNNYIMVTTPEPLPWETGKIRVTLKHKTTGAVKELKRINPTYDTLHVFVPGDGKGLVKGDYELTFVYSRKFPGINPTEVKEKIPGLTFYKDSEIGSHISTESRTLSFKRSL